MASSRRIARTVAAGFGSLFAVAVWWITNFWTGSNTSGQRSSPWESNLSDSSAPHAAREMMDGCDTAALATDPDPACRVWFSWLSIATMARVGMDRSVVIRT